MFTGMDSLFLSGTHVNTAEYPLEDIREFFIRRPFLHGEYKPLSRERVNWDVWTEESYVEYNEHQYKLRLEHPYPITAKEYVLLKSRKLELSPERIRYLNAFIEGYWWGR